MCEEQHMHNERVWNIKHGLVHHSFTAGLAEEAKEKKKKNYTGVITPQAWIEGMETLLSDSKVLTLPGGFKPTASKSLAFVCKGIDSSERLTTVLTTGTQNLNIPNTAETRIIPK